MYRQELDTATLLPDDCLDPAQDGSACIRDVYLSIFVYVSMDGNISENQVIKMSFCENEYALLSLAVVKTILQLLH